MLKSETRKGEATFPRSASTIIDTVPAQILDPEVGGTAFSVKAGACRLLVQTVRLAGESHRQHLAAAES